MRRKEYLAIHEWQTKYNGPAIYCLTGKTGKRYIGQTIHLQNRLNSHRRAFNRIVKGTVKERVESHVLTNAVSSGEMFTVEVLKRIPDTIATSSILSYWEQYYIKKYDTFHSGYNSGQSGTVNPFHGPWNIPIALLGGRVKGPETKERWDKIKDGK